MKLFYLLLITFINISSCRTQDGNRRNLRDSGQALQQRTNIDKNKIKSAFELPELMDNLEIEAVVAFVEKEDGEQKPIATLQISTKKNDAVSKSQIDEDEDEDKDKDKDKDEDEDEDEDEKNQSLVEEMLVAGAAGAAEAAKKTALEYKKYIINTKFSSHIGNLKHDKEITASTNIDSKNLNFKERKIISENETSMLLIIKDKDGNRHLCKMYNDGSSTPFYDAFLEILGIKKTIKKALLAQKNQLVQHGRYSSFETSGTGYIIKSFHSEESTLLDLLTSSTTDNNKISSQQEKDLFKLVEDLITPDKNGKYLALGEVTPGRIAWNPEKGKWIVLDSMPYKVFASKKAALNYTIENITKISPTKNSKNINIKNSARQIEIEFKQRKNIDFKQKFTNPEIKAPNKHMKTIKSFAAAGATAALMSGLETIMGLTAIKYSCVIQDTLCFEFNLSHQSNIEKVNKWCEQLYTYLPNAKDVYIQEGKDCSEDFNPCHSLINEKLLYTVHIHKDEAISMCEHMEKFQEQQKQTTP
jgi:hypothetical protein